MTTNATSCNEPPRSVALHPTDSAASSSSRPTEAIIDALDHASDRRSAVREALAMLERAECDLRVDLYNAVARQAEHDEEAARAVEEIERRYRAARIETDRLREAVMSAPDLHLGARAFNALVAHLRDVDHLGLLDRAVRSRLRQLLVNHSMYPVDRRYAWRKFLADRPALAATLGSLAGRSV